MFVIPLIDGSFALVWHDSRDNTVHVCRNDDRPFHIAHIKDEDTIIATSENEMLDFMLLRNGYEVEEQYKAGSGYEFIFSLDALTKPRVIKHELYEDQWANYGYGNSTD